jgi:hypothetical protein
MLTGNVSCPDFLHEKVLVVVVPICKQKCFDLIQWKNTFNGMFFQVADLI